MCLCFLQCHFYIWKFHICTVTPFVRNHLVFFRAAWRLYEVNLLNRNVFTTSAFRLIYIKALSLFAYINIYLAPLYRYLNCFVCSPFSKCSPLASTSPEKGLQKVGCTWNALHNIFHFYPLFTDLCMRYLDVSSYQNYFVFVIVVCCLKQKMVNRMWQMKVSHRAM